MAFDPTKDYITRKEKYLTVMAGNTDISYPEPITREEHYLAAMCDPDNNTAPDPITRREQYLSAIVQKISEGGGGLGELIATKEFTVNTTSTSATDVGTIDLPSDIDYNHKVFYCRVRDKAGERQGYFFGTDAFVVHTVIGNFSNYSMMVFAYNSLNGVTLTSTNSYGVYLNAVSLTNKTATIRSRYNSSLSCTVDGTYLVEIYLRDIE